MSSNIRDDLKRLLGRDFDVVEVPGGFMVEFINYKAPEKKLVGKSEEEAVTLLVDYLLSKVSDGTT